MGWSEMQWRCDGCGSIQTGEYSWNGKCDGCNRTVGEKTNFDIFVVHDLEVKNGEIIEVKLENEKI